MTDRPIDLVRFTRTATLLAWTVGFMWLLGQDHFAAFLRPGLRPLVMVGLVMLALFLVASASNRHQSHAHGPAGNPWTRAAVLLLPLAYLALGNAAPLDSYAFAKRHVGGHAAGNAAATQPESAAGQPAAVVVGIPGEQAKRLTILELMQDEDLFKGHRVVTEGMVSEDERAPKGDFVLFRFVVTCCVADAQPLGLLVTPSGKQQFLKDTWVRVEGISSFKDVAGEKQLFIQAEKIEPIKSPNSPYLQPF